MHRTGSTLILHRVVLVMGISIFLDIEYCMVLRYGYAEAMNYETLIRESIYIVTFLNRCAHSNTAEAKYLQYSNCFCIATTPSFTAYLYSS